MNVTLPVKKGAKIWLELQAENDTDIMDERELCSLIYSENNRLGGFTVTQLVIKPDYFKTGLAEEIMEVLRKHGVNLHA